MTRATRAEIDLSALQHNLNVCQKVATTAKVVAVIKANAYGHGIIPVAKALNAADAFAVACLHEAVSLREAGIEKTIIVLEGFQRAADLKVVRQHDLACVVHHANQIEILEAYAGSPITIWLKVDTGMHRLGVQTEELPALYQRLQSCAAVHKSLCVMTHLACADDLDDQYTQGQIDLFNQVLTTLPANEKLPVSVVNSGGLLGWPAAHGDWVRPGIMLYGVSPFKGSNGDAHKLKPAMTLSSELIAINTHRKGDRVGYGGTFQCPEDMPVGVVANRYR